MEEIDFQQLPHINFICLQRSPFNKCSYVVVQAGDAFSVEVEGWIYNSIRVFLPVPVIHCWPAKHSDIWLFEGLIFEVNVLVATSVDDKTKRDYSNEPSGAKWNGFYTGPYERFPIFGDSSVHQIAIR